MLRFDLAPVCSNAYRFQAAVTFLVSAVYLFTPYQWLALILAVGGLIRGFISPHKCPSYRMFAALTTKAGWARKVNAGAKMFADKLGHGCRDRHDSRRGVAGVLIHRPHRWILRGLLGLRPVVQAAWGGLTATV